MCIVDIVNIIHLHVTCALSWFSYNLLTRFGSDDVTPAFEIIAHYSPCDGIQNCRQLGSIDIVPVSDSDHYVSVYAFAGVLTVGKIQSMI